MENKAYDAGHFSFLELIKVITNLAGHSFAKGALIKTGMTAARQAQEVTFDTVEDFLKSVETLDNPIARFEGEAKHYGNGVFGLPECPFAGSIETYTTVTGGLPKQYAAVTDEMNKPSRITEDLRVAEGAAVSPFCAVHQPIRSALGDRVKVAGRVLKVYQLGCKSGAGKIGVANRWVEETKVSPELVQRILDDNMCCYCVRFEKQ